MCQRFRQNHLQDLVLTPINVPEFWTTRIWKIFDPLDPTIDLTISCQIDRE
jgi:hypothetical protein